MTITNKQREELVDNKLHIEFVEIKLTRPKTKRPFTYTGPGTISQDTDGNLNLKMYYKYESEQEMVEDTKATFHRDTVIPGTLVGEDHFASLEGQDFKGNVWIANNFTTDNSISFVARGRIIKAVLNSIKTVSSTNKEEDKSTSFFSTIIPGKFSIPCNRVEETENNISLNTCEISFDNLKSSTIKRENHIELTCSLKGDTVHKDTYQLFLEAFGISIGNYFRPICEISRTGDKHETIIYSKKSNAPNRSIAPPIPSSHHNIQSLRDFTYKYMDAFKKPHSVFFVFWWRIFNAFFDWVENRALITATSVEGVLKEYFKGEGMPDKIYLSQAVEACPKLKNMDIGHRIKERILSSLQQSKSPTPKNILFALQRKGLLTEKTISSYISLRNQVSHPTAKEYSNDEFQRLLDKTYSCLGLFYELLFIHIGYKGGKIDYSERGWPTKAMPNA